MICIVIWSVICALSHAIHSVQMPSHSYSTLCICSPCKATCRQTMAMRSSEIVQVIRITSYEYDAPFSYKTPTSSAAGK